MTPARRVRQVYGRSRSRPLRPRHRDLIDRLLPALTLDPAAEALDPARAFGRPVRAVWLEVGFGAGEHLAWQAAHNRDVGFVGCEPYLQGVARLLAEIEAEGLDNVRLHTGEASTLIAGLEDASLARCFVLFPDPWPKRRHHKRRFINPETLDLLARAMADGAELRLATDDMAYGRWMLSALLGHDAFEWLAERARDWRDKPANWPETRYEAKARAAGREILYLRVRRRPRAAQRA